MIMMQYKVTTSVAGFLLMSLLLQYGNLCNAKMIEYDLGQNETIYGISDSRRYQYTVQCLVGCRCFLQSDTDYSWYSEFILDSIWSLDDDAESLRWFCIWKGAKI
jgi:hypothetical protein